MKEYIMEENGSVSNSSFTGVLAVAKAQEKNLAEDERIQIVI